MEYYNRNIILKSGERIDELQRNGYGIIQSENNFCFGMDAVLLSGFAAAKKGETVVDLCTGTGIIPILLTAKTDGKYFYGIEIQPDMADMAQRSVLLNALQDKVEIICSDVCGLIRKDTLRTKDKEDTVCDSLEGLMKLRGRIDVVTCNPPYMKESHGIKNPDDARAIARHEIKCTLRDICLAASALLRSGGRFYMVHRPLRLPEIITELKNARLEPKRIKPVYPFIDKEANMVLIEAVKDAGPECRFEKPVIVYSSPGVYTDEIYDIYGY